MAALSTVDFWDGFHRRVRKRSLYGSHCQEKVDRGPKCKSTIRATAVAAVDTSITRRLLPVTIFCVHLGFWPQLEVVSLIHEDITATSTPACMVASINSAISHSHLCRGLSLTRGCAIAGFRPRLDIEFSQHCDSSRVDMNSSLAPRSCTIAMSMRSPCWLANHALH